MSSGNFANKHQMHKTLIVLNRKQVYQLKIGKHECGKIVCYNAVILPVICAFLFPVDMMGLYYVVLMKNNCYKFCTGVDLQILLSSELLSF